MAFKNQFIVLSALNNNFFLFFFFFFTREISQSQGDERVEIETEKKRIEWQRKIAPDGFYNLTNQYKIHTEKRKEKKNRTESEVKKKQQHYSHFIMSRWSL